MEFKMINKLEEGNYITRYNLHYETADGKNKIYEMQSKVDQTTFFKFDCLYLNY